MATDHEERSALYRELLEAIHRAESALEALPDASSDTEALVRIELANVLARARVIAQALEADSAA